MKHGNPNRSTNLLSVPSPDTADALVNLADWVETRAMLDPDQSASIEDLVRSVRQMYSTSEDRARILAQDAFLELGDRGRCCLPAGNTSGTAYPFALENGDRLLRYVPARVRTKPGFVYAFLLVTTRSPMDSTTRKLANLDPTALFEQLCADVLLDFWGGKSTHSDSVIFGSRSGTTGKRFAEKIGELCTLMKHGHGLKLGANEPGSGDGKLDIAVWRLFDDDRSGALIGFAQCKTGVHWNQHLTKLQPRAFCEKFFSTPPPVDPVRLYLVPNRIERQIWDDHSRDGGILLDRCRLVRHSKKVSAGTIQSCRTWFDAALHRQKELVQI